jgi:hypothetical protein
MSYYGSFPTFGVRTAKMDSRQESLTPTARPSGRSVNSSKPAMNWQFVSGICYSLIPMDPVFEPHISGLSGNPQSAIAPPKAPVPSLHSCEIIRQRLSLSSTDSGLSAAASFSGTSNPSITIELIRLLALCLCIHHVVAVPRVICRGRASIAVRHNGIFAVADASGHWRQGESVSKSCPSSTADGLLLHHVGR